MNWITFQHWNRTQLRKEWEQAQPFPHVIVDNAVPADRLQTLREAVAAEPHGPNCSALYEMMASAETVQHATLRGFQQSLQIPSFLETLHAITTRRVQTADLRSYVYLEGSFLLPHTDSGRDNRRQIAYMLYLSDPAHSTGGELLLYEATLHKGEVVATRQASSIRPEAGRLVLFEVSNHSLHEVSEITQGARVSLTGWFYE